MLKLVLLRHGQSAYNLENKFTGWKDVDLSDQGIREAHEAGALLKAGGYTFDVAYTSVLRRAIKTLWIVLEEMDLMWIPIHCSWRLNERHYGALQDLDKKATTDEYGERQVHIWRRSYNIPPPPLSDDDPRQHIDDPRYRNLEPGELPKSESLQDTLVRVLPSYHDAIYPSLKEGKHVIIAAHGNSLRALVKHLDNVSDEKIPELEIPTGTPLVYEFDSNLRVIRHYYLHKNEPSPQNK